MRKVLLTVMMVSSLLAFNACKKDGAVGPAGPKGDTGAAGAQGPAGAVGAAGAKGADGTKILSGTVDPTTEGAVGDFYFNKTSKTLWGPKVAAGWAGTSTGLTGATGATGAAGNKFLFGAGVPDATNPTNAKEGDFYFDTNTSIFYGPKAADGTWTSVLPLSSNYAAKTYSIAKSFESIKENLNARSFGQSVQVSYDNYNLFTSYQVTANDMIRINQYPGWQTNREMKIETIANSNVFDLVVTYPMLATLNVGTKFVYTNEPTKQFNITQSDIDRLSVNNGAAFNYLTYAAAQDVTQGINLVLATRKNLKVVDDATRFHTTYTAVTKFNLDAIPGLGADINKYKQEGKVFVQYKYYTSKSNAASTNNVLVTVSNANAGWTDLTTWANSFVNGTGSYSLVNNQNPFSGTWSVNTNFMTSGTYFGNNGAANKANFAPDNQAEGMMDLTGGANGPTAKGKFSVDWAINSGDLQAAVPHAVSDPYYNNAGGNLYYTNASGGVNTATLVPNTNQITYNDTKNGLEASVIGGIKLVQIYVKVYPASVVNAAAAKGVNVNDAVAMANFIKL